MKTIKRVSLSEQVLNSVIQYMKENGLKPGDQLPTENEFSELFGVSRTSVREAIKALSINGALTSIPGKGTFLQQKAVPLLIDGSDLLQMEVRTTINEVMEVRTPLEVQAVELAAQRCTDEDVDALEEISRKYRQAVESGSDCSIWGKQFHAKIAAVAANALLTNTLQSLAAMTDLYRGNLAQSNSEVDFYMRSHDNMCAAFRRHDAAAAGREMRSHMQQTMRALTGMVNEENAICFIPRFPN